ncbi:extracellular solute-binding protein [bacterium]|nr:MAG: extracellular solute-binding protein [bacterium]
MGCGLSRPWRTFLYFSVAITFFFSLEALKSTTPGDATAAELKESWKVEWEKIVEGARKEGRLYLYLYQGDGELEAVANEFQKKYPAIAITKVTGRGNQLGPRIMAERRAGKYLADVYIGGPTTPYSVFYPARVLDPIRNALILPEVVDESKWWEGKHYYIDPENKYIFVFVGSASGGYVSYNSKLVNPREFNSYWDLVQPRWKGKILSKDPKISGSQRIGVRILYYTAEIGPEFLRRLYSEMDVVLSQEIRQSTDWLANGKFSICFFCGSSEIQKARQQGLPVDEFMTARWKESPAISAGSTGSLVLMNQAPHPNAARLFINWLLSKEGQIAYQKVTNTPINSEESMRIDVPKEMIPPEERRVDGVAYLFADRPEFMEMKPIYEVLDKALAQAGEK